MFVVPHQIEQRHRGCQQRFHCRHALLADHVIRIKPGGQRHDLQAVPGAQQGEGAHRRLHCRALARVVAIEAQQRLVHHAPEQFDLPFGQRGAHWCHGVVNPGRGQRDHVHVAFDHDNPA